MTQPKLRVGDTFVYTEEMEHCSPVDHKNNIGKELKVADILYNEYGYQISYEIDGQYYKYDLIDPFLPKEEPNPRTLDDALIIMNTILKLLISICYHQSPAPSTM